jgi:hypothetical protein
VVVVLAALAVLGATLSVSGIAGADDPPPRISAGDSGNVHSPLPDGREVAEAWTTERMRAAMPVELGEIPGAARAEVSESGPTGVPVFIPGGRPGQSEAGEVPYSAAMEASATLTGRGYKHPAPFTGFNVPIGEHKKYPRRTVGVLFFTYKGGDYRCSAASIGNYAIFTAGHCVHDGSGKQNGWSDDLVFVPAYNGNKGCPGKGCPFGVWEWDHSWVNANWFMDMNWNHDMAGVILKKGGRQEDQPASRLAGLRLEHPGAAALELLRLSVGFPVQREANGHLSRVPGLSGECW